MRIAIINITGGGVSGGYRTYLRNIIPRMALSSAVEALLCASLESLNVQDWFGLLPNVMFVNCKPFRFLRHSPNQELKRHLEGFSPDVLFVPSERFFRFDKIPVINMVQNMEPFTPGIEGNPFSEQLRNWVRSIDGRRTLKKSDRVIAISRYVRDFLVQHWNIPNNKIGLVYHGIDIKRNEVGHRPHIIPESWHGKFIFTAGSIRPARGLGDLLWALKYLLSQGLNTLKLVIAGEADQRMICYQKKMYDMIQMHNISSKVCWTGSLNENEMAWCYQNCKVFVMTSRVESFGMIAGEAMSYGCICISADNPCLPEIFGDAAIYYQPKNGKALAGAIQTVLAWDDNQRKVMSEKAKKRAAKFSWDICAEKTVAVLAKATKDFNK